MRYMVIQAGVEKEIDGCEQSNLYVGQNLSICVWIGDGFEENYHNNNWLQMKDLTNGVLIIVND